MQKRIYGAIVLGIIICSFTFIKVQKKLIRQEGYDIECFVYLEELTSFDEGKTYYWFRNSQIHQSNGFAGGLVLHDTYTKYYRSNQLAEKGAFDLGLKDGVWLTWYENGSLKSSQEWWNGVKHGDYRYYDTEGKLIYQGNYKRDTRHGEWIDHLKKDTLNYKRGEVIIEEVDTVQKPSFLKRLFGKKEKDSLEENKPGFFKRLFTKKNDSLQQNKPLNKEKDTATSPNFFQRLFGKKEKKKQEKNKK